MANLFAPDRTTDAALSKQSILRQQKALYQMAYRCLPVLWESFVLPVLLAKKENRSESGVTYSLQSLDRLLQKVVDNESSRRDVVQLLCRHDYLRRKADGHFTAGTRLWKEVHARKMIKALQEQRGE